MRIFFIICALLIPTMAFSQEIQLLDKEFRETVTENARVSGDIVMGVMLIDDSPYSGAPSIMTSNHWSGGDAAAQVCVRIVTKSGRYESENTYVVPESYQKANAVFPYEGNRLDILASEYAAALVKNGPCGSRSAVVVPVLSHAQQTNEADTLQVFVNAAGNPVDVAWGRNQIADCDNVTELNGLKYTARCEVPLAAFPHSDPAILTFFIARGNTEETFQLSVLSPYVQE